MRKTIGFKTAILASLFILGMLAIFHTAIVIGILFDYVPIDFLWGGQIKTETQLLNFEIVSLLTTFIFVFLLFIRSKWLNLPKLLGVTRVSMWVLFILFSLNTIGNVLAINTLERMFAIVSGVLALLFLRIAIEKECDNVLKTNQP